MKSSLRRGISKQSPGTTSLVPTLRAILAGPATPGASISDSGGSSSPAPEPEPETVIQGWVKSVRGHKNVVFAEVTDGSTYETLQAVLKGKARLEGLDAGASVRLKGRLVESRGSGQSKELLVSEQGSEILGRCDPETYPIQRKSLPPPVLRDIAHLRFRTTQTASVMRVRDALARDWHDWFEENEFIHINTPILTSSDCEGAGETFAVTTSSSQQHATTATSNSNPSFASGSTHESASPASPPEPFFPTPVNLTVSSQLHLEAPTHSLARTYTLSPSFRAERSMTSRHLSEFYMLEAEISFVDTLEQLLDVVESGITAVLQSLVAGSGRRWDGLRGDLSRIGESQLEEQSGLRSASSRGPLEHILAVHKSPFKRMTYTEAINTLSTQHSLAPFVHTPSWGESLSSEHEKWLAATFGPTFVTHYPASQKPFYMLPSSADPSYTKTISTFSAEGGEREPTVACFDLLFPNIGELAGGSLREHRLSHLELAIEKAGLDRKAYEWYLDLRRYGSVPHGGWGMGWERWVSWVTGVGNVRDVVAFPRWKGSCRY